MGDATDRLRPTPSPRRGRAGRGRGPRRLGRRLRELPLLVILAAIGGLAMLAPAALAAKGGDWFAARVFFQAAMLVLLVVAMVAVAAVNYRPRSTARSHLAALLVTFTLLPLMLALPLRYLLPGMGWGALWFEMLSALTTTGATLFADPGQLSQPVNLWRALVGWMGGFLMLVVAVAIFAPLNIGGFEIASPPPRDGRAAALARIRTADLSERLAVHARRLLPVYLGATVLLALLLRLSGQRAFTATIDAMATLSTSGIDAGTSAGGRGMLAELAIFLFLMLALSRVTFSPGRGAGRIARILHDRELRLAGLILLGLSLALFARHVLGAYGRSAHADPLAALQALWGGLFTTLGYLTTAGFESRYWSMARDWSALPVPGLVLMSLAFVGGGIATTAGGIKLLRVHALIRQGQRELTRLTYPHAVAGAGSIARHVRREGALSAWVFFMIFAMTAATVMLALGLLGHGFRESLVLATAALTTTGPLAPAVLGDPGAWAGLGAGARTILGVAMILGRFEMLAMIALLSPDFWRS